MHSVLNIVSVVLLLSLFVVIHELGHFLVARAFGMRVLAFSVGFGPALARWTPKGSETEYRIGAIPLLAYVQIAGMGPRDSATPDDRGTFASAPLLGRVLTIAAGPLANYLAAIVVIAILFTFGGQPRATTTIEHVLPSSAAAQAGLHAADTILRVDGRPITAFTEVIEATQRSAGRTMQLVVRRGTEEVPVAVTPRRDGSTQHYLIGIRARQHIVPVPANQIVQYSIEYPGEVAMGIVTQLRRAIVREANLELSGPIGIIADAAEQAKEGWRSLLYTMSAISVALFVFNLLPIPALDGGRLLLLGFEVALRRKIDPQLEARIVGISMTFLLTVFAVVSLKDLWVRIFAPFIAFLTGT